MKHLDLFNKVYASLINEWSGYEDNPYDAIDGFDIKKRYPFDELFRNEWFIVYELDGKNGGHSFFDVDAFISNFSSDSEIYPTEFEEAKFRKSAFEFIYPGFAYLITDLSGRPLYITSLKTGILKDANNNFPEKNFQLEETLKRIETIFKKMVSIPEDSDIQKFYDLCLSPEV